jgi:aspartate/glutamate racemase
MDDKLILVHTVQPLLNVFNKLGAELIPGVQLMHVLDEPLLERVRQRGYLAPEDSEQLQTYVAVAEQIGASAVLVTCSTISPCVDDVQLAAGLPVIKIDEAMIAKAIKHGSKIGVVATAGTTLEPTRQLLRAQADASDKQIEIELVLVDNALKALLSGDGATHDKLVKQAVLELAKQVDVVVLAQATMARVLDAISEAERPTPILSSPHLALEVIKKLLVIKE